MPYKLLDSFIYNNKNRNVIKKWLLNPPPKNHELILEMMGFVPKVGMSFRNDFDNKYSSKEIPLCYSCLNDLQLKNGADNMCTFFCLLQALSHFLISSERLKKYKIHLKKIELNKDFTTK